MNFHDALPKIGRQSISFLIKDLITSWLLSGELKPGDKLPTEIDLAQKLGVGRNSVVREALKMLSSIGALEVRKGSGTFIAKRMKPSILNPLILSLVFEQGTSKEFIELRLLLEIGSAELALSKITAGDLERLEQLNLILMKEGGKKQGTQRDCWNSTLLFTWSCTGSPETSFSSNWLSPYTRFSLLPSKKLLEPTPSACLPKSSDGD